MPYTIDSKDLPSNVQALGDKLKSLWVRTWNSVYAKKKDEQSAFRIANKMVRTAKKSAEGELESDVTDDQLEVFVAAELEEKPSRPYLSKLRDTLMGLRGKQLDDAAINRIVRQSAGSAGGQKRAQNATRTASEIEDYQVFYEFADPPATVNVLPVPGTYKHPSYGDIKITKKRNQHFVDNFNDKVYQEKLPIDAEHQTKLSGAFGWINNLVLNADGSVDAEVEWTDRGTTAIENDRFKYFSPEWYDEWTDPADGKSYKDVLIGGAITTRPFFKDASLKPLVASELEFDDSWVDETEQEFREIPDSMTFDQIRESAYRSLREQYPVTGGGVDDYAYITDIYPNALIYCRSGKDFRVPYELSSDGEVTIDFTDSKQVERYTIWRPVSASEEPDEKINDDADTDVTLQEASQPDVADVHVNRMQKGRRKKYMDPKIDIRKFAEDSEYKELDADGKVEFLEGAMRDLVGQLDTASSKAEDASKATEQAEAARMATEARLAGVEAQLRRQRFAEMVRQPNPWYGETEKNVSRLEKLASAFGEESDEFKEFVADQQTLAAQFAESKLFGEIGHATHVEGDSEFAKAVKAYKEAHPDASDAEAQVAVADVNPKFYEEYRKRLYSEQRKDTNDIVAV